MALAPATPVGQRVPRMLHSTWGTSSTEWASTIKKLLPCLVSIYADALDLTQCLYAARTQLLLCTYTSFPLVLYINGIHMHIHHLYPYCSQVQNFDEIDSLGDRQNSQEKLATDLHSLSGCGWQAYILHKCLWQQFVLLLSLGPSKLTNDTHHHRVSKKTAVMSKRVWIGGVR